MLETLRGAIAYMREKQLLHKLGVALSIAIIAAACYILYNMLQGSRSRRSLCSPA